MVVFLSRAEDTRKPRGVTRYARKRNHRNTRVGWVFFSRFRFITNDVAVPIQCLLRRDVVCNARRARAREDYSFSNTNIENDRTLTTEWRKRKNPTDIDSPKSLWATTRFTVSKTERIQMICETRERIKRAAQNLNISSKQHKQISPIYVRFMNRKHITTNLQIYNRLY